MLFNNVNILNATELYTEKWWNLCYVYFTVIFMFFKIKEYELWEYLLMVAFYYPSLISTKAILSRAIKDHLKKRDLTFCFKYGATLSSQEYFQQKHSTLGLLCPLGFVQLELHIAD